MEFTAPQVEDTSTSPSSPGETPTYSRAYLRALHGKPMKAAWSRHVTGAVEFIKERVLSEALAGYTARDFSAIIDAVPTADEVLEAIGLHETQAAAPAQAPPSFQLSPSFHGTAFGAPETWKASGKLDPKTGLLLAVSMLSGKTELRLSGQCMPDIVAALKRVFTDSDVEFVKAAPSSGGKDVLSIKWS